jgi:hypothetical protein
MGGSISIILQCLPFKYVYVTIPGNLVTQRHFRGKYIIISSSSIIIKARARWSVPLPIGIVLVFTLDLGLPTFLLPSGL